MAAESFPAWRRRPRARGLGRLFLLAAARRAPLAELAAEPALPDQGVDPAEDLNIGRDAAEA